MSTKVKHMTGQKKIGKLNVCQFDIVSGCQLKCVGCPSSSIKQKVSAIEPENFRRYLDNIKVQSIDTFRLFNFGEPLLHPNLPEIIDVLADYRSRTPIGIVELSTNAQFALWDQFEDVLRRGVINRIVVSCDGDGTPECYEILRPPAKYGKLIYFLSRVGEFVATHQLTIELMTRTVIEKLSDRDRWIATLKPLGWTPEFRGWKNLPLAPINKTGRAPVLGKGVCKFLEPGQLYIDADGTVVPCCAHPRAAEIGNLGNQTLSEVQEGPLRKHLLMQLSHHRETMSVCGACEFGPSSDPGASAGANLPDY